MNNNNEAEKDMRTLKDQELNNVIGGLSVNAAIAAFNMVNEDMEVSALNRHDIKQDFVK